MYMTPGQMLWHLTTEWGLSLESLDTKTLSSQVDNVLESFSFLSSQVSQLLTNSRFWSLAGHWDPGWVAGSKEWREDKEIKAPGGSRMQWKMNKQWETFCIFFTHLKNMAWRRDMRYNISPQSFWGVSVGIPSDWWVDVLEGELAQQCLQLSPPHGQLASQGPTHANARPTAPGMAAIGAPEAKRVRAGNSTPPEASASCYRVYQKCFEHWDICKGKSGVVHCFERPDVFAHFGWLVFMSAWPPNEWLLKEQLNNNEPQPCSAHFSHLPQWARMRFLWIIVPRKRIWRALASHCFRI